MRLVDVDALIVYIKKRIRNEMIIAWLCRIIGEVPTIEAVPVRHGYWMCGDYYDIGDVCSECDWDSGMVNPTLRYCPNCGAKMDLEG